jgi:IclR family KDG regulon transcriptional repressor
MEYHSEGMATDSERTDADGVSTTRKTFGILETLKSNQGATVTELTRETDLPKSTVFRHLATLQDLGYVVEQDGGYYIGLRFLELSERARNRQRGYTTAKWKVYELAEETGEHALFLVEENGEGVYLHRMGSRFDTLIGKRRPLHAMASGKVILAEWSEEALDAHIDEIGLDRLTDNTLTDPEGLRSELATIRERGYAINDQEHMDGLRAVAVPVYSPEEDDLLGSLSVFGPTSRFKHEFMHEKLPGLLKDKASEVKVRLAYE